MRARGLIAALIIGASLSLAGPAHARQTEGYTYSFDQLWRASIRLLAVDFRFPITERDRDIGYFLFTYVDGERSYHGSLELVRTPSHEVRVTIQVPQMPSYVERHLLDRLGRKLTEDYGQPPPGERPSPPAAPTPPADEAPSGDEDEGTAR